MALLSCILLALSCWATAFSETPQQACDGVDGRCDGQEQQVLLQRKNENRRLDSSSIATRQGTCTNVAWDCQTAGQDRENAMQVLNSRPDGAACQGSRLARLNVLNGNYETLCEFPSDCFNACGINPLDSMIYCELDTIPSYLVRLTCPTNGDPGSFCFLGTQFNSVSGGFSPRSIPPTSANFVFVAFADATVRAQGGLENLPGYLTVDDVTPFPDLTTFAINITRQPILQTSADLTVRRATIDGRDDLWLISCENDNVIIQNLERPEFFYSVTMQPTNAPSPQGEAGAQWDFDGFIYCAYNNGDGVYEILVDDVDVQSLEVPVTLVSQSQELIQTTNDGLNCITVEPPFTTTSTTSTTTTVIIEACFNDPFDCTDTGISYRWPMTSDRSPAEILRLNVGANTYSVVCNFPDNTGLQLEACGINPVDSTIYCTEQQGSNRASS
ncbi:unnamed protein product [Symbiodinium sp. CCMP2592]|nr:unnamed protein product [Symbiodinium sp. CCMP2592]